MFDTLAYAAAKSSSALRRRADTGNLVDQVALEHSTNQYPPSLNHSFAQIRC